MLVALLFCAVSVPASAQSRGSISGTVSDTSGAIVQGVIIDALSGGQVVATATSGADGRYRLDVPASGVITLRARLQGFEEVDAEASPNSTRDLTLRIAAVGDTLLVTAARTTETRANTTASVSVFTAKDIAGIGAASLSDVLRTAPGLSVEATGREGSLTSLFARGGESDYNLVLIDGVRVNQTGGAFDFSRIAASEIDRVEVVRGGQSSLYGSDAVGSVVQIFTRRAGAAESPRLVGSVEGGSFNTWRGDATVLGGASGRADYAFGVSHRRTDGAFADLLPEDDRFEQTAVNAGGGVVLGTAATLRSGVRYSNAHARSIGPIDFGSRDTGTAYDTKDWSWHLDLAHRITPRLNGNASVAYSRSDSLSADTVADPTRQLYAVLSGTIGARFPASPRLVRFVDLATFDALRAGTQPLAAGEFLATTPFGVSDFPFSSSTSFRRPAFKYQADWHWSDGQPLTGGYEFERESDPLDSGFNFTNHAFFAQQQFHLRDRWFVTAGARVDDNSRFGTTASPRLSAGGYLLPMRAAGLSSLKVFGNLGRGIKNPQFNELFNSAFSDGNPDLVPERALTADAGLEATFADQRVRSTVTFFDSHYRDQVAFKSTGFTPDGRPDYINIAGSKAHGVELEAAVPRPIAGLTGSASYTFLDSEVTATVSTGAQFQPGQPLLRRPKHSGFVRVGYTAARATASVDVRIVGQRHDSPFTGLSTVATSQAVDITVNPGYTVAGLGLDYAFTDAVSAFVRIDNLADEQYETALGYPGMPRSAYLGVRFGIGDR